jgi:hypothetical protein
MWTIISSLALARRSNLGVLLAQGSDLDVALQFVKRRINEEALRSCDPLTDDQRDLLEDLPAEQFLPEAYAGDPEYIPLPRDLAFERLCALARAAHRRDRTLNPTERDWQFAKAVTQLYEHPMSWLLGWAGVQSRRPWSDAWLLVVCAIFCISTCILLMFVGLETRLWLRCPISASGLALLIAGMYFGTKQLERLQLSKKIEKYRRT